MSAPSRDRGRGGASGPHDPNRPRGGANDPLLPIMEENPQLVWLILGSVAVALVWWRAQAVGLGLISGVLIGGAWGAIVGAGERWTPHVVFAALAGALVGFGAAVGLAAPNPQLGASAGAVAARVEPGHAGCATP